MAIVLQFDIDEKGSVRNLRQINKAIKDVDKSGKQAAAGGVKSLNKSFGNLKNMLVAGGVIYAIRGLKRGFDDVTRAAAIQEDAEKGLAQAFKTTGQYTKETIERLKVYASELQRLTRYGDEVTLSAMTILEQLTGLNEQGIKKLMPGIQDLARAFGFDLNTAASLVGKTLGSTTNALTRYGIQIDMTGSKAQKLSSLVSELNNKFGGTSQVEGYRKTVEQMSNAWGDVKEEIGFAITNNDEFNSSLRTTLSLMYDIADAMKQNRMEEGADKWFKRMGIKPLPDISRLPGTLSIYDLVPGRRLIESGGDFYKYKDYQKYLQYLGEQRAIKNFPYEPIEATGIQEQANAYREAVKQYQESGRNLSTEWAVIPEDLVIENYDNLILANEEYNKQITDLQQGLKEANIRLAYDGYQEEKELLKLRFEEEYGMLQENDKRKILAREVLNKELAILDQQAKKENDVLNKQAADEEQRLTEMRLRAMEMDIMRWSVTWGNMLDNAVRDSGNAFENIASDFQRMVERMTAQAVAAGIFNIATGSVAGGFFGGAETFFKNIMGFQSGGYTGGGYPGDIAGVVHKGEYVMPASAVNYYGKSQLDSMARGNTNNNTYHNDNLTLNIYTQPGERITELDVHQIAQKVKQAKRMRLLGD